jgi:HSP20 family protein
MVQRRSALSEVTTLQKDVRKLFEQLAQFETSETGLGLGEWFPRVDVFETRNVVVVKVEAPGFSKNELRVAFRGSKLVLSGEKKQASLGKSVRGYLCLERSFGKFTRSLYIDRAVDLTKARAVLDKGVLTLTLPRVTDRRGAEFRINVEDASDSERRAKKTRAGSKQSNGKQR